MINTPPVEKDDSEFSTVIPIPEDTVSYISFKKKETSEHFTYVYENLKDHIGVDLYFLTVTIKPKFYKYGSGTQFDITRPTMSQVLYNSRFALYVPEHTKQGNIHYHAIVKFKDEVNKIFILNSLKAKRDLGFIKLTPAPIKDKDALKRSVTYMVKDLKSSARILHTTVYKPELIITPTLN